MSTGTTTTFHGLTFKHPLGGGEVALVHEGARVRVGRGELLVLRDGLLVAVAKLTGSSKLVYEQENRRDKANGVLHWRVVPSVVPDKVTAEGRFTVTPTPEGCAQAVVGNISVRIPFLGGKIENAIVAEVEESYKKYAEAARRWLAEHR